LAGQEFHSRWRDTWKQLGVALPDQQLFREVLACYGEPRRKYHSLQHLGECLEHFDELRSEMTKRFDRVDKELAELDRDFSALRGFVANELPLTILIDAQGHEVARAAGAQAWDAADSVAYLKAISAPKPASGS